MHLNIYFDHIDSFVYSLDLCITDRCNQHCPHCYVNPRSAMEDLPTQTILDLLSECSEQGATNFHVFGGEPFLRDDLQEIFSYAFDLNFTLSVATNGIQVTQNDFEWLQRFNPFLGITLHGPPAFHDNFTRMEGAYEKSLETLKAALKLDLNVGVITCITRVNFARYYSWMQQLVDLGVQTFFILYFSPLGRGLERKDFQISNEEWESLAQSLREYHLTTANRVSFYFEPSVISRTNLLYARPSTPCALYTKSNCVVDANGDIYPCILFLRNPVYSLGNYTLNSLYEIWDRFTQQIWKDSFPAIEGSGCGTCEFLRLCKRGCPAYLKAGQDFRCNAKYVPICPLYTELL